MNDTIHTPRLLLRPFTEADEPAALAYLTDLLTMRYTYHGPKDAAAVRDFLRHAIRTAHEFAITRANDGALLGGCGLTVDVDLQEAMLSWTLHHPHWRQGYGREVAEALLRFGFDTLHLHRLFGSCDARNVASAHLMARCGMRLESHHIKNRRIHWEGAPSWQDELEYAILSDEWKERNHHVHH
jgi:RimJ/RimL family protein N-acetyltransferase